MTELKIGSVYRIRYESENNKVKTYVIRINCIYFGMDTWHVIPGIIIEAEDLATKEKLSYAGNRIHSMELIGCEKDL